MTSNIERVKIDKILTKKDIPAETSIGPIINKFDNKEDLENYKT